MVKHLEYILIATTAFIFTLYHAVLTSILIARIDYLDLSFGYIFFVECVAFVPLGIGMVVITWLGKKYPKLFISLSYGTIAKHILIAGTIFIVHSFWQPYMNSIFFGTEYYLERSLTDFISFMEMRFLIYVIIVGLVSGLIKMREQQEIIIKQSELNLKLQKARLRELELKMNPEIIYPNLSFIRNKAEDNPELASQMVISMAGILRKLVDNFDHEETKLSDEVNLFKVYAELLKLRLEHYFEIRVGLSKAIGTETVPSLILLAPLFEELLFGKYENHFQSIEEMFFTGTRISENKFMVSISIKNISDEESLSNKIKAEPIVKAIQELLNSLRNGTYLFEPIVEGKNLLLSLQSVKQPESANG